jgi:hypothetical protein
MAVLWRFPLQPQQNAAGTAVTGGTSLTSGLIGSEFPVLPAGVAVPGARLVLRAHGEVTSTSATPTVTLGFYFGTVGQAIGSETVLAASAGLAVLSTATAWPFTMIWNGTIRSLATGVSANGVIHGSGEVFWWGNVGLTGAASVNPMPVTAAARTVSSLNTQVNNQVDVGVTLSSATGTPSVTITDFWAELTG